MKAITFLAAVSMMTLALCLTSASPAQAENGVTASRILIGESTALTGEDSERPIQFHKGSQLYFDKFNEDGGVHGRKIKVVTYDDGYEPKRTYANVQKLIKDDKVFALFQIYGTPTNKSALAAVEPAGIPLIAPVSAGEFLRTPVRPNIFTVRPGASGESNAMVGILIDKGIRDISVLHMDNALGMAGLAGSQQAFMKLGIIRKSEGRLARNLKDVDEAVAQIEKGNPKGILLWTVGKGTADFVKKYSAKHQDMTFVGHSGTFTTEFLEDLKGVKAEVYVTQGSPPLQSELPLVTQYLKLSKAAGETPSSTGLEGFLNAAVLAEGLKRTGPELTRASFLSAMEHMNNVSVGGIDITFGPGNHQALSRYYLYKFENDRFNLIR